MRFYELDLPNFCLLEFWEACLFWNKMSNARTISLPELFAQRVGTQRIGPSAARLLRHGPKMATSRSFVYYLFTIKQTCCVTRFLFSSETNLYTMTQTVWIRDKPADNDNACDARCVGSASAWGASCCSHQVDCSAWSRAGGSPHASCATSRGAPSPPDADTSAQQPCDWSMTLQMHL